jgi:predicted hotdog family 3-hydroxylacyl-ACP dehydratase
MIGRETIAGLVPHAGTMCLLDSIQSWDSDRIACRTRSHRAPDNPLRQGGRLGALAGIELAAQAMAAHGRLAGAVTERPRAGFIASLRDVVCRNARLDQFEDDLVVTATRLMGDQNHVIYAFAISCASQDLVTGRATVILQADAPP